MRVSRISIGKSFMPALPLLIRPLSPSEPSHPPQPPTVGSMWKKPRPVRLSTPAQTTIIQSPELPAAPFSGSTGLSAFTVRSISRPSGLKYHAHGDGSTAPTTEPRLTLTDSGANEPPFVGRSGATRSL